MQIGQRILKLRKEQTMSQDDLSYLINVSRQTISKWENNESSPDMENIKSLARVFSVTTDYLINGEKNIKDELKSSKINIIKDYIVLVIVIFFLLLAIIIFIINPKGTDEISSIIYIRPRTLILIVAIFLILTGLYFGYKKRK